MVSSCGGVDVSTPTATFYIDGVAQSTTVQTSNATSIKNGADDFRVSSQDGTKNYFDGLIDDLRV